MTCIPIKNGILCMANVEFHCPYCNLTYFDAGERYLTKVNANKSGYTKINCECGEKFGMTYDFKGNAVGFKLNKSVLTSVDLIEIDKAIAQRKQNPNTK